MALADQTEMRRRFSENLRERRVAAGFTQEALAFRAGLHRTEVSLLENHQRLPSFETLIRLAGALGATPADLTAGIEFEPIVALGGGIRVGDEFTPEANPLFVGDRDKGG